MAKIIDWLKVTHTTIHEWLDPALEKLNLPRWVVPLGAASLVAGVYIYRNPVLVIKAGMYLPLYQGGFKVKYVKGKKNTYCYAERGKLNPEQPSMLLISGFGGSKIDWAVCAMGLPRDKHIILLDQLGQGGSTIPTDPADLQLHVIRDCIAEFAFLLKLDTVGIHMMGISMGGSLTALLAAKYPKLVNRATMLCPAMKCPVETQVWKAGQEFADRMYSNLTNYRAEIERMLSNTPVLPKSNWIWKGIFQLAMESKAFTDKFSKITQHYFDEEPEKFKEVLSTIRVPAQVIWGENDQIVDVSGATVLKELVPTLKRVDILPCGHLIIGDMPEKTRSLIMEFHNTSFSD